MTRIPSNRRPTHPGEMFREEFLRPLCLTQRELSKRLGISYPRLSEISHRRRAMTSDTALRLEQLLGVDAQFWLNLQLAWDLCRARAHPRQGPPAHRAATAASTSVVTFTSITGRR